MSTHGRLITHYSLQRPDEPAHGQDGQNARTARIIFNTLWHRMAHRRTIVLAVAGTGGTSPAAMSAWAVHGMSGILRVQARTRRCASALNVQMNADEMR